MINDTKPAIPGWGIPLPGVDEKLIEPARIHGVTA